MKHRVKSVTKMLSAIFGCVMGLSHSASATQPSPTCALEDVQINTVTKLGGTEAPINVLINASDCFVVEGVVNNFFNHSFLDPSNNLGYDNDGWLNKDSPEGWWDGPGAFIDDADLLDLDGDGDMDDPGWIYVGKDEGSGFVGATSHDDNSSYTFKNDLIEFNNGGIGSKSGEWVYSPPPNNPKPLLNLLGGSFFDQVAIVFKAGNGFAIYNFTIEDLGITPVLAGQFNYAFSGTWNIEGSMGKALSNMSFWARDPVVATTKVPEPSSIALFLLSGLFLFGSKKLRK